MTGPTTRVIGAATAVVALVLVVVFAVVPSSAEDTVGTLMADSWSCELEREEYEDDASEWDVEIEEDGGFRIERSEFGGTESYAGEWTFEDGRLQAEVDDLDSDVDAQQQEIDVDGSLDTVTLQWDASGRGPSTLDCERDG